MPRVSYKTQYSFGIIALCRRPHPICQGLLLPHKLPKCDVCYDKLVSCFKDPKSHVHETLEWDHPSWSVLLIQRRQTMAYYDFLRAHYLSVPNGPLRSQFLKVLLSEMTCEEREYLRSNDFEQLWKREQSFSYGAPRYQYRLERLQKLYEELDIPTLLKNTPSCHYATAEFGFPKGKTKPRESPWRTATREFCEETGYNLDHIRSMGYKGIVTENFVATNGIPYHHTYYVMDFTHEQGHISYSRRNQNQYCEVQNLFWCPVNHVCDVFRPYDKAKQVCLKQAVSLVVND